MINVHILHYEYCIKYNFDFINFYTYIEQQLVCFLISRSLLVSTVSHTCALLQSNVEQILRSRIFTADFLLCVHVSNLSKFSCFLFKDAISCENSLISNEFCQAMTIRCHLICHVSCFVWSWHFYLVCIVRTFSIPVFLTHYSQVVLVFPMWSAWVAMVHCGLVA